jgi:hypothetical protein
MSNLKERLFEMYDEELNSQRCDKCLRLKLKPGRKKLGPISFWHLGSKFFDKRFPTIAFVGKTTWMNEDDYDSLPKNGRVYDGTSIAEDFFTRLKEFQYWQVIDSISKVVRSKADSAVNFLDHIFVTNLVKCNVCDQKARSTNVTGKAFYRNCIDVFEKEIEVTKPSHIVFFAGAGYDNLIGDLRFGYRRDEYWDEENDRYRQPITKRNLRNREVWWWHRVFQQEGKPTLQFLRTRHPQGAPEELKDKIIKWILGKTNKKKETEKLGDKELKEFWDTLFKTAKCKDCGKPLETEHEKENEQCISCEMLDEKIRSDIQAQYEDE